MKQLSRSKKIILLAVITVISITIGVFAGIAIQFSKKEYTSASDVFTLMKVNFSSGYSILKTDILAEQSADNYSDTYQAIMVKDHEDFAEFLKNKGCKEYKPQQMTRYYLSTADGKKFILKSSHASDGIFGACPYSIELMEGVTMDDILAH